VGSAAITDANQGKVSNRLIFRFVKPADYRVNETADTVIDGSDINPCKKDIDHINKYPELSTSFRYWGRDVMH
jgi:hypothetical protein